MLWCFLCVVGVVYQPGPSCASRQFQADAFRNPAELIRSRGYVAEEHETITQDGYILSLQRIPFGRQAPLFTPFVRKPPVLLVHGLLSSAVEWVINESHQSLGYLLADAGYDVWLGNCRGTPYSRHVRYHDGEAQYWDYRLDEVAIFDLPALVDHVLSRSGSVQLFLIGFSQGNTAAWAMLADRPEYNTKVRLLIALAPVANMTFIRSPVRFLVPISPVLTAAYQTFNRGRLLVRPPWIRNIAYVVCESGLRYICALPTFFLFGVNLQQINESKLAVYTSHIPSGAAKLNVEQYAQIIRARNFQKFDYGQLGNLALYGSADTPAYDLSKVTAPVALFSARNDFFANTDDVATLRQALPNVVFDYVVPDPDFTHLDFVLGSKANKVLYSQVIRLMNQWNLLESL
ncbi:lipase member K-like [Haemaphysalis longicornis]